MAKFTASLSQGDERGSAVFAVVPTGAITGITAANPAVVTIANSGNNAFANGEYVTVKGVAGMTEINGLVGKVASRSATGITLSDIDSSGFTAYTSAGTATKVSGVTTSPGVLLTVDTLIYDSTEKASLINDLDRLRNRILEADWPPTA